MSNGTATPPTNPPAEPKNIVPPGYRLVEEEDYKTKAAAALDLKKLKEQVESLGVSLEEAKSGMTELSKLKGQNLDDLTKKVDSLSKKLKEKDDELKTAVTTNLQNSLKMKFNQFVGKVKGEDGREVVLLDEYIDFNALYALNPDDPKIEEQLKAVAYNAYEKQQAAFKRAGYATEAPVNPVQPITSPVNPLNPTTQQQSLVDVQRQLENEVSYMGVQGQVKRMQESLDRMKGSK